MKDQMVQQVLWIDKELQIHLIIQQENQKYFYYQQEQVVQELH